MQQPHLAHHHAQSIGLIGINHSVGSEQRRLEHLLPLFIEDRDGLAPSPFLPIIDLAEVEHLPLHRSLAGHAA